MRQTLLRTTLAVGVFIFTVGVSRAQAIADAAVGQAVMQVDEQFRLAKLNKDTATLDRILADNFYEMNQNGNGRNKAEFIELFKTFPISTLTTDSFTVRLAGDTASVTGSQNENGDIPMLFLRVYVKGPNGWQLLSSLQARNPKVHNSTLQHLRAQDLGRQAQVLKVTLASLAEQRSQLLQKVSWLDEQAKLLEQQLARLGR